MVESTHVYSAVLIGSPDVALKVKGGSFTLDVGSAPHVRGRLDIALPSQAVQTALDPRLNKRVRLTVAATYPSGAKSRVFNLSLRDRSIPHTEGEPTISLELASDEALLGDYAPLADDSTPMTLASSLRSIVNYVLNKAITGTSLAASPALNADLTPYWRVTNLMPNPAARTAVGNWIPGGANGTLTRETGWVGSTIGGEDTTVTTAFLTTWAGNSGLAAGGAFGQTATIVPYVPVTPGKKYTVYTRVHSTVAKNVQLSAQIFGADGAVLSGGVVMATPTLAANTWTWVRGEIEIPANAARIGPFLYAAPGVQWVPGEVLRTTKWMVHEGVYPMRLPWFDRATPDDANYTYEASGDDDVSASTRTPVNDATSPDALIWKAGQTAMEFLAPLVQVAGYRLVCDESRVWTLRDETYESPGALSIRHGVNLIEGEDSIDRDSGIWYDAAVTTYRWTDADGIQRERVDSYALTTPYTRLYTSAKTTAYPGPGFSEYLVRRAQGRGREVTATSVADWDAEAEQPITIVLENAPTQTGLTQRVTFDLDNDEMTCLTRTIELGARSIALLTGTINGLTGTINAL